MITEIPRTSLRPWSAQPRKHFDKAKMAELVDSLRARGQLQPLIVRPVADGADGITHEIITGERRWRASATAGIQRLDCRVMEDLPDKEAAEIAVMENEAREDLTVMEVALGYKFMVQQGWSVAEIALRSGRKEPVIYSLLELCDLDEGTKRELIDGTISRETARVLGRIRDLGDREEALKRIVQPRTQDQPLPEKRARELLQTEYLAPQKRADLWEKKQAMIERAFPGAEIIPLRAAGRYGAPEWAEAEKSPAAYELAVHVRDEEIPTWGKLAEKHGAPRVVIPDPLGNPVLMVPVEPIKAGEMAAGEKNPENCIFPISGGEGRHEQSIKRQEKDLNAELEARKAYEDRMLYQQNMLQAIHQVCTHPQMALGDAELHAALPQITGWLIEHEWLTDLDEQAAALGIDVESLGDGDSQEGQRRWAIRQVEDHGLRGFLALVLSYAVSGMSAGSPDLIERLAPIADVIGEGERPRSAVRLAEISLL